MRNLIITILTSIVFPLILSCILTIDKPVSEFIDTLVILSSCIFVIFFSFVAVKISNKMIGKYKKLIVFGLVGGIGGFSFILFYEELVNIKIIWGLVNLKLILSCIGLGILASVIWLLIEKLTFFVMKKSWFEE
ncbi:hypothetical protein [Gottfriedia luciferensis]|uniref:hypothetical protein n=1 Tax=Gottfriedia luciferensis TaxID=178774 RepID=UPI000B4521B2|nr:hypothetical protein [Gottfriedia luciferensis]